MPVGADPTDEPVDDQPAADEPLNAAIAERAVHALRVVHSALPAIIGLSVLAGILVTLWRLASIRYPYLGWAQTVANDGKAISFGHWIYGDPAEQYTGMLYTPLYPSVLGLLYRTMWWDGWPIAVSTLAGLTSATCVGVVAASGLGRGARLAERAVAAFGGIGLAGCAWWFVSTDYRHLLYEGRADQLAWCFALLGLCVLARSVAREHATVWPAVLLFSAGLWTKQSTVGAVLAAVVALTWWMVRGATTRRIWSRFGLGLALTNIVTLAVVEVLSKGWAIYFLLTMPGRHMRDAKVFAYLQELRNLLVSPLSLVLLAALGFVLTRPQRGWPGSANAWRSDVSRDLRNVVRRSTRAEPRNVPAFAQALLLLILLFLVLQFPAAFTARRKQGGEINQYIGMLWGVAMLLALAHRMARRRPRALLSGIVAYALLIGAVHTGPIRSFVEERAVPLPTTYPTATFVAVPVALRDYARTHEVYTPFGSDLSSQFTHHSWPMQQNIVDLLAAGEQPMYLVDAFIERRFDAVQFFDVSADPYASAFGKTEENYLWKLNQVLAAGYVPDASVGLLVRKPGDVDLSWMRACFGPFNLAGNEWRIHHGGGLWCNEAPSALTMRSSVAEVTEVETKGSIDLGGTITGTLPGHRGSFEVVVVTKEGQWAVLVGALGGGAFALAERRPDGTVTTSVRYFPTGDRVTVALGASGALGDLQLAPSEERGQVLLRTSNDNAATFVFAPR